MRNFLLGLGLGLEIGGISVVGIGIHAYGMNFWFGFLIMFLSGFGLVYLLAYSDMLKECARLMARERAVVLMETDRRNRRERVDNVSYMRVVKKEENN